MNITLISVSASPRYDSQYYVDRMPLGRPDQDVTDELYIYLNLYHFQGPADDTAEHIRVPQILSRSTVVRKLDKVFPLAYELRAATITLTC